VKDESAGGVPGRCEVCGLGEPVASHVATEMMFGMGGSFEYRECGNCGSLALADVPSGLGDYYPQEYYSFMAGGGPSPRAPVEGVRRAAMRVVASGETAARLVVRGARAVGVQVEPWVQVLGGSGIGPQAAVLDIGCGAGRRLRRLRRYGFRNLTGIDAHLPGSVASKDETVLLKATPQEVGGQFDLVMFHHSLEHMESPVEVLEAALGLLRPSGMVLVRVPLVGAQAWRTYGVHWVQLDAPRHIFLFSARGIDLLAERSGFAVTKVIYDSTSFQFWGSEQYRRGIPLRDPSRPEVAPSPMFSASDLSDFDRRARELNAKQDGDQAVFVLRRRTEVERSVQ